MSEVIPEMTKVAWQLKKGDIQKDIPGITRDKFLYHLSRASYEQQWTAKYRKPGFGARLLALLTRLIPKIGPFRALSLRAPTPETDKLFMASFNATVESYRAFAEAVDNECRRCRSWRPFSMCDDAACREQNKTLQTKGLQAAGRHGARIA